MVHTYNQITITHYKILITNLPVVTISTDKMITNLPVKH